MERYDVVIAGGGLIGSSCARAFAQCGLTVALIDPVAEAAKPADFDGRAYALSISSCNLLAALGLWSELAPQAQPINQIKVSDGHAGKGPSPLAMAFDCAEIEEGPMGHMLQDRYLRAALHQTLTQDPNIDLIDTKVVDHTARSGAMDIHTATGDLSTSLFVAADGRNSPARARAGIGRVSWQYGQTAMVAAIAHERPHNGVAHQFFMPQGPLAILPLPGNRASIVWTEDTARAEHILGLDANAFLDYLRPRFGSFLGDISLIGARYSYPLGLSLAHAFIAPRLALIGDAAHAVHPIAGQGLNAGLKDVAALVEVVSEAQARGEDLGRKEVLERYQTWRRFDAATLALATDGFNRLFSNDNPILRLGRDLGLGLVDRIPALRRGLIREAAGLSGDRPKLMERRARS